MRRAALFLSILVGVTALGGCARSDDVRDGTFVGNPGKLDVTVVGIPDDISVSSAVLAVDQVWLLDCDGKETTLDVSSVLDALGPDEVGIEIPFGWYCEAILSPAVDPLTIDGSTTGGTNFTATIDPGALTVDDEFYVDETWLLWSLPVDGLDADAIDAIGGTDVILDVEDPITIAAANVLTGAAGLYEDVDQSGTLGGSDFLASAPPGGIPSDTGNIKGAADPGADNAAFASAEKSGGGCSCDTGSEPAALGVWLGLVALIGARRRSAQSPTRLQRS